MITISQLTKRYGAHTALDDVTFEARSGRVTGFLGPNGAGKSTAMRILCGFAPADSGAALVDGRRYVDIPNPGRHVGTLLDAGARHKGRSGHESLLLAARMMGLPDSSADRALERVGLTAKEGRRLAGGYSLGMGQRLGLAQALLGEPRVLVLDEPANGLDPAGIRWMRGLLRDFADDGGTVLLSSHLLSEVERVADDLVVIGRGRIVAQGSVAELSGQEGTLVRAADRHALVRVLEQAGIDVTVRTDGGVHAAASTARVGEAVHGVLPLTELRPLSDGGLEELFLRLTADDAREGVAA